MRKLILATIVFLLATSATADVLLVMQYNDNVRIVLSKQPCDHKGFAGWIAVAQRIDKQFIRGCWTREPHSALVRVQWNFDAKVKDDPNSFSVLDADRFYPVEVDG